MEYWGVRDVVREDLNRAHIKGIDIEPKLEIPKMRGARESTC